jgi:prolyl-tRNA synthetase
MQRDLFERALAFRREHTYSADDYETFKTMNAEQPGFIWAPWCGGGECEERVAEETKATIRTVPFDPDEGLVTQDAPPAEQGACLVCGRPSPRRVLWGKAY